MFLPDTALATDVHDMTEKQFNWAMTENLKHKKKKADIEKKKMEVAQKKAQAAACALGMKTLGMTQIDIFKNFCNYIV